MIIVKRLNYLVTSKERSAVERSNHTPAAQRNACMIIYQWDNHTKCGTGTWLTLQYNAPLSIIKFRQKKMIKEVWFERDSLLPHSPYLCFSPLSGMLVKLSNRESRGKYMPPESRHWWVYPFYNTFLTTAKVVML